VNVVERFVDAVNRRDVDGIAACFHEDFEMVVPQRPARGFRGREQEVKNMRFLVESRPEGRIEIRRMVEDGDEVWIQNTYRADGLHMEAVVIYEIDRATDTILVGHYYSEEVTHDSPEIDDWMQALGHDA
jgi:ketosteroid isomerase-like protein